MTNFELKYNVKVSVNLNKRVRNKVYTMWYTIDRNSFYHCQVKPGYWTQEVSSASFEKTSTTFVTNNLEQESTAYAKMFIVDLNTQYSVKRRSKVHLLKHSQNFFFRKTLPFAFRHILLIYFQDFESNKPDPKFLRLKASNDEDTATFSNKKWRCS